MDHDLLQRQFAKIGARLTVARELRRLRQQPQTTIDVRQDRRGEYFEILRSDDSNLSVETVDVRPRQRHLLLMVREAVEGKPEKHKFLCGHDERHWFVAALPKVAGLAGVASALEALKPDQVRQAQSRQGLSSGDRSRRKNAAFLRQGEWFFIPCPELAFDLKWVLKNEPIRRGRAKPHWCEFLHRRGGETVYVSHAYPNGLTTEEYRSLLQSDPSKASLRWTVMVRNAEVYVKGRISHPDHKTIVLRSWHRVEMNTEFQAPAIRHVAFLD